MSGLKLLLVIVLLVFATTGLLLDRIRPRAEAILLVPSTAGGTEVVFDIAREDILESPTALAIGTANTSDIRCIDGDPECNHVWLPPQGSPATTLRAFRIVGPDRLALRLPVSDLRYTFQEPARLLIGLSNGRDEQIQLSPHGSISVALSRQDHSVLLLRGHVTVGGPCTTHARVTFLHFPTVIRDLSKCQSGWALSSERPATVELTTADMQIRASAADLTIEGESIMPSMLERLSERAPPWINLLAILAGLVTVIGAFRNAVRTIVIAIGLASLLGSAVEATGIEDGSKRRINVEKFIVGIGVDGSVRGSGILIGQDHILTAYHVLHESNPTENSPVICVLSAPVIEGRLTPSNCEDKGATGEIVYRSEVYDLAVVRASIAFPDVSGFRFLGSSSRCGPGCRVLLSTYDDPSKRLYSDPGTIAVSSGDRLTIDWPSLTESPGWSGGAILDKKLRLVGLYTEDDSSGQQSFGVPFDTVRAILPDDIPMEHKVKRKLDRWLVAGILATIGSGYVLNERNDDLDRAVSGIEVMPAVTRGQEIIRNRAIAEVQSLESERDIWAAVTGVVVTASATYITTKYLWPRFRTWKNNCKRRWVKCNS